MSETDIGVIERSPSKSSVLQFHVREYDALDSTSEELKRLVRVGQTEGFAVRADAQHRGHGRYGREWYSPSGNLYLSWLLLPEESFRVLSQLSFVVALAVGDAVSGLFTDKQDIQFKWPNDVLIGGKKVGGLLLESSLAQGKDQVDWLIVGVGVNITSFPSNVDFPATSIEAEDGKVVAPNVLSQAVLDSFARLYAIWKTEGFAPIRTAWLEKASHIGESITVTTVTDSFVGVFEDITPQGELVITLADGKKRCISAGEVFFTADHARK